MMYVVKYVSSVEKRVKANIIIINIIVIITLTIRHIIQYHKYVIHAHNVPILNCILFIFPITFHNNYFCYKNLIIFFILIISISVYPKAINENQDTEENRKKLQNLNNTRNLGGKSSCKKNDELNKIKVANDNYDDYDYINTPSVDFQISKSRNSRRSRR